MSIDIFYTLSLEERMELLNKQGECISRIFFYGCTVNLYAYEGLYIEVYYNRHSKELADINVLDPVDERLHQYAVQVNLSNLYQK